jgi:hypothetical protein
VARTLVAGLRTATRAGGFTLRREEVNGQPGALFFDREDRVDGVMILDVANGQIQGVSSIVNPDKLRHLGPVADLRALYTGPDTPRFPAGTSPAANGKASSWAASVGRGHQAETMAVTEGGGPSPQPPGGARKTPNTDGQRLR